MCGKEDSREKIREAIRAGVLPRCRPERMWGGRGSGADCLVCGALVGPDAAEMEIEFVREHDSRSVYHVHVSCFAAWEQERQNLEGELECSPVDAFGAVSASFQGDAGARCRILSHATRHDKIRPRGPDPAQKRGPA